jgi:hypothetical protein
MPRKRTPQQRTTTKPTVEPAGDKLASANRADLGPAPWDLQDDVIDAVIVDDDDPNAVAAEISANLAVPWDERKADLAAMETIAQALAWQARAQVLLNERDIPALAKHVDDAADLPLGPTRLRRLVPIDVAADIAARYVPGMRGNVSDGLDHVRYAVAAVEAPPRADVGVINGSEEEWPTLSHLIGPVIEPAGGVWGDAG